MKLNNIETEILYELYKKNQKFEDFFKKLYEISVYAKTSEINEYYQEYLLYDKMLIRKQKIQKINNNNNTVNINKINKNILCILVKSNTYNCYYFNNNIISFISLYYQYKNEYIKYRLEEILNNIDNVNYKLININMEAIDLNKKYIIT